MKDEKQKRCHSDPEHREGEESAFEFTSAFAVITAQAEIQPNYKAFQKMFSAVIKNPLDSRLRGNDGI
ncbi:MAG: hypothetical protein WCE43_01240 [Burkholderiales bacterium]